LRAGLGGFAPDPAQGLGLQFALSPVMPVSVRVMRTLLGVMLAVLLGMLLAPLAWLQPR
jgi:hypothetical protein